MAVDRSIGGIGQLFCEDELVGQVYYNIAAKQPRGIVVCTIVFIEREVTLPNDDQRYKLCLEDDRYMLVTISPSRDGQLSPYFCTASDGILHNDSSTDET